MSSSSGGLLDEKRRWTRRGGGKTTTTTTTTTTTPLSAVDGNHRSNSNEPNPVHPPSSSSDAADAAASIESTLVDETSRDVPETTERGGIRRTGESSASTSRLQNAEKRVDSDEEEKAEVNDEMRSLDRDNESSILESVTTNTRYPAPTPYKYTNSLPLQNPSPTSLRLDDEDNNSPHDDDDRIVEPGAVQVQHLDENGNPMVGRSSDNNLNDSSIAGIRRRNSRWSFMSSPSQFYVEDLILMPMENSSAFDLAGGSSQNRPGRRLSRGPTTARNERWANAACLGAIGAVLLLVLILTAVMVIGKDDSNTSNSADNDSAVRDNNPVVATVLDDICLDRVPGQGWMGTDASAAAASPLCTRAQTLQQGGGGIGNLVAMARLDQVSSAAIAIVNAGECRAELPAGPVTELQIQSLLPFENNLYVVSMTGLQMVRVLEQALEYMISQNRTGAYPYVAGLRFDVDLTAPAMNRLSNVQVNPRLEATAGWTTLEQQQSYSVLVTSYLADGGDGYREFLSLPEGHYHSSFTTSRASFKNYCTWAKTIQNPTRDMFSTQTFVGLGYGKDGDSVVVDGVPAVRE